MIDLLKAKDEFIKYTENYDLTNENIERKQKHSIRVMDISTKIAKSLNLSKEEYEIASLIGLLHDIARFEQYTQYKTFRDRESFDHGDYGVKILEKDIRKYIETDKYDSIIKIAVKNHNKFQIEDGLTETELFYSKLIRDADKLDILYEAADIFWKGIEDEISKEKISEEMVNKFNERKTIKRQGTGTKKIDAMIITLAFIYDLNFKESFEILEEKEYINKILDRFDFKDEYTKEKIEEMRKIANEFIKEKIG